MEGLGILSIGWRKAVSISIHIISGTKEGTFRLAGMLFETTKGSKGLANR